MGETAGLWMDGWFYASAAGLLISGALFFYLLGQYRAAAEADDRPEAEPAPAGEPSEGDAAPELEPALEEPIPQVVALEPEKTQEPPPAAAIPGVDVVPLIEGLREELHELSRRVDILAGRDKGVIERLEEIARAVAALKIAAPPAEAPAPRRARKAEPHAPTAELPAPKPAELPLGSVTPTPASSPDSVPAAQEAAQSVPAPAAEPSAAPAIEEAPRRGPVWPV